MTLSLLTLVPWMYDIRFGQQFIYDNSVTYYIGQRELASALF